MVQQGSSSARVARAPSPAPTSHRHPHTGVLIQACQACNALGCLPQGEALFSRRDGSIRVSSVKQAHRHAVEQALRAVVKQAQVGVQEHARHHRCAHLRVRPGAHTRQ